MINQSYNNPPITPLKISRQKFKKFMRKPSQCSQRSSSKKSIDNNSLKQMYIKTPTLVRKKQQDFFVSLANSFISTNNQNKNYSDKKLENYQRFKPEPTDRTNLTQFEDIRVDIKNRNDYNQPIMKNLHLRVKTLQAQLDLRNHQASLLSSQCQRLKQSIQDQRQKRKSIEQQRKQIARQLKQTIRCSETLKTQIKKLQKQRQHFVKQIQFFQRINYDDKTRSLQSYRQKYLEQQLLKVRKQLIKSRGQRQEYFQNQIKQLKQQKYTMQSHFKALKVANQCLIKQINNINQNQHNFVLNSEEYKKLRDKYIRFLEQYKQLRTQFWALKTQKQLTKGGNSDNSQIFSITASEVQNDLSQLKIVISGTEKENSILSHSQSQINIPTYANIDSYSNSYHQCQKPLQKSRHK